jgi:hypothetical protein
MKAKGKTAMGKSIRAAKAVKKPKARKTVKKQVPMKAVKPKSSRVTPKKMVKPTKRKIRKPSNRSPTSTKQVSLSQSLNALHKEMEKSLKRIEIMMMEVQHKEHHPKIRKTINSFKKKQQRHLMKIAQKS